jgi:hypothetical protein
MDLKCLLYSGFEVQEAVEYVDGEIIIIPCPWQYVTKQQCSRMLLRF